ncbi:MAG: hypothetical protein HOY71_04295, partial [Nonomuraea sp.]|nr:hypothetical protein [Nonomuraea sp.]
MQVSLSSQAPAEVAADLLVLPESAAPALGLAEALDRARFDQELLLPRRDE